MSDEEKLAYQGILIIYSVFPKQMLTSFPHNNNISGGTLNKQSWTTVYLFIHIVTVTLEAADVGDMTLNQTTFTLTLIQHNNIYNKADQSGLISALHVIPQETSYR